MLKDRQELRAFREECVRAYNAYKRKILVCAGTGCVSSGSLNIYASLSRRRVYTARWSLSTSRNPKA